MPYREHPAGAALEPWVECLWSRTVDAREASRRTSVLPDGCADILFSIGAPFGPADGGPQAWVVGTQRRPLAVDVPAGAVIIAVRFRPGGGGPFLGLPLRQTRDAAVPLEEIWPDRAPGMLAELVGVAPHEAADRLRALLGSMLPDRAIDPLVAAALARITRHHGGLRVRELAEGLGVGARRLQRAFARDVGVSAKRLCRIARAREARRLAATGAVADPLDLVARCGYHDQPHLARELREILDRTPGQLLAES